MDPRLLRIFLYQAHAQCEFAQMAYADLERALAENPGPRREFWFAVQNFLNATANMAKTFYGPTNDAKTFNKRRPVRESIGLGDKSPIRDVGIRNDFEHFDHRVDQWWKSTVEKGMGLTYLDNNFGPRQVFGVPPKAWFRHYDQVDHVLLFWGQEYHLHPVIAEVRRIAPLLAAIVRLDELPPAQAPGA